MANEQMMARMLIDGETNDCSAMWKAGKKIRQNCSREEEHREKSSQLLPKHLYVGHFLRHTNFVNHVTVYLQLIKALGEMLYSPVQK